MEYCRIVLWTRRLLMALAASFFTVVASAASAPKPVMVHYMPWFVAKPFSTSWGFHWTMNHYTPDLTNSDGRQQIASWYYPLIGPYDSADPAVLEYHVALMKLAGIDGVIVDWYGSDNYNDYTVNNVRTLALLNYIRKAGLKFSLCYEDATIQNEITGKFITAAGAVAHAQQTLLYVQSNYFSDPSYFRLNGAPVFLNFGPQYFTASSSWTSIFSVLSSSNVPAFFTEDNRLSAGAGAFDWPPMYLSGGGTNVLTPAQLQNYFNTFEHNAASWPAFVSSAFPRFHDIYAQSGVGASFGYLDDANGLTLSNAFVRAVTNHSAVVQVVTWNDFGEGTVVEPTLDYGYRDLGILQNLRRQYLDATFPYQTNDLALAYRLYNLRKQFGKNAAIAAELDRVFTNIVTGALPTASLQLTGMETGRPVIYNLSLNSAQMQFAVGGYVASNLQVQMSTNLGDWQTVKTFPAGTNMDIYDVSTSNSDKGFYRVH